MKIIDRVKREISNDPFVKKVLEIMHIAYSKYEFYSSCHCYEDYDRAHETRKDKDRCPQYAHDKQHIHFYENSCSYCLNDAKATTAQIHTHPEID